jgi:hypothetical protein
MEPLNRPAGASLARDVLEGHDLEEAARAIAAAFRRLHP